MECPRCELGWDEALPGCALVSVECNCSPEDRRRLLRMLGLIETNEE